MFGMNMTTNAPRNQIQFMFYNSILRPSIWVECNSVSQCISVSTEPGSVHVWRDYALRVEHDFDVNREYKL